MAAQLPRICTGSWWIRSWGKGAEEGLQGVQELHEAVSPIHGAEEGVIVLVADELMVGSSVEGAVED